MRLTSPPPHVPPFFFTATWRALRLIRCSVTTSALSSQQHLPVSTVSAGVHDLSGGGGARGGGPCCCGWVAGDLALCAFIAACVLAQAGLYFMTAQVWEAGMKSEATKANQGDGAFPLGSLGCVGQGGTLDKAPEYLRLWGASPVHALPYSL